MSTTVVHAAATPTRGSESDGASKGDDPGCATLGGPVPPPMASAEDFTLRRWLSGASLPREASFLLGFVAPAIALLVNLWRVRQFTIDDAYISFRYARNLARGLGLVYNAGERIEGYTNFLWTVLLAGGIKLGLDPDALSKVLGGLSALGGLWFTYRLSERFRPFGRLPCVATWLLATTPVFTGYSVFGLETSFFVFLVVAGLYLFFREEDAAAARRGRATALERVPWSGLVLGLAGLTRPETPLFLGVPMLWLGLRIFSPRNLARGALFVAVVGAHVAWRRSYYGEWLPNTLSAKTGNLEGQILGGWTYVQQYASHAGPLLWLAVLGVSYAIFGRRRDLASIATLAGLFTAYVVLVGGDWMPYFRFLAPFEPLCFLLVDVAARSLFDRKERAVMVALAIFGAAITVYRIAAIREAQRSIVHNEDRFWKMAAGGTAKWLLEHERGEIAIGDIGYVGYATDYPLLDLLGLVDPVISKLPGGYTRKIGPGYLDRFFDKKPMYFLLISSDIDCQKPSVPGSRAVFNDPRFKPLYEVAGKVPLDGGFAWCIYRRKGAP